jgi:DNA-binding beta-propeller fold protein YncE
VGAFALIAGSTPDAITPYTTCTGAAAPQVVTTPGVPSMLRPLPDGAQVLAMDSPGIDYLDVSTTSTGCPPTISNTYAGSVNLGQGSFVPKQFILSPDGRTAYILTENSGTILVFSVSNKTTSAITLTGNAIALQASLTPDGRFLYVGAEDVPPPLDSTSPAALGTVHVLDTLSGVDAQQIIFPQNEQIPQPFCLGPGNPPLPPPSPVTYCYPDIVAVKP